MKVKLANESNYLYYDEADNEVYFNETHQSFMVWTQQQHTKNSLDSLWYKELVSIPSYHKTPATYSENITECQNITGLNSGQIYTCNP